MLIKSKDFGGKKTDHTTSPVSVAQASATQDPEFLDAAGLQSRFGIKRSLAYVLLGDGLIRGVSLRRRGQLRGKRLFDVGSVRTFLAKQQMESEDGK
jgi:hypothetical protein